MFEDPNKRQAFFDALGKMGAGLTTGNNWSQQLANANLGISSAVEQQKQTAEAAQIKNSTVQMLQAQSPELANAVAAGVMTPSQAYAEFIKVKSQKAEFKTLDDGTYGTWDGKEFKPLGKAQKPATPQFQKFDDGSYGFVDPTQQTVNITGKVEKPIAPTELVKNLEAAGYKQGTPEFQQALMHAMKKPGMSLETDADGNVKFVQGDVQNMPKLTVEQGRNAGFLIRAKAAEDVISKVEKEGTSLYNKGAASAPFNLGNYAIGEDAQKYEQAQRDFVNSVLRQESGAVINPDEFNNAKVQYFPQPGDGPQVIEQKRQNRENAIEGFKLRSGPGADVNTNGADPLGLR